MTIVKKLQKKIVNVCTLTQKEEWARHKRNGERGEGWKDREEIQIFIEML